MLSFTTKQNIHSKQKSDIATILRSKNLDLYLFETCLNINLKYTVDFLEKHPEVIERIKKLFMDVDTYFCQKNLRGQINKLVDESYVKSNYHDLARSLREPNKCDSTILCQEYIPKTYWDDVLAECGDDTDKIERFAMEYFYDVIAEDYLKEQHELAKKIDEWFHFEFNETEKRLKQCSGEEVFRILTTVSTDGGKRASCLENLLVNYYAQAGWLSDREDRDLYYTSLGEGTRSAFEYVDDALNMIGKYQDQPEVEEMFETRLLDCITLKKIDGQSENWSCVDSHGQDAYVMAMQKTLLHDPVSKESAFYIKYINDIIALPILNYKNIERLLYVVKSLIKSHPDIALQILTVATSEKKLVKKPDLLVDIYETSKNDVILPMIADAIEFHLSDRRNSFYYKLLAYKACRNVDNPVFSNIFKAPLDKEIIIMFDCVSLFNEDIDYTPILKYGATASVEKITFEDPNQILPEKNMLEYFPNVKEILFKASKDYEVDANIFSKSKNLTELYLDDVIIKNDVELLKQLPYIESIRKDYTGYSYSDAFWECLKTNKPKNLKTIGLNKAERENEDKFDALMDQYLTLSIGGGFKSRRNEAIRDAIEGKSSAHYGEPYYDLFYRHGFIEYLKIADEKELNRFKETCPIEKMVESIRHHYKENAQTVLLQAADLLGLSHIKIESELVQAINEKRLIEFLKSLNSASRPKLMSFFKDETITLEENVLFRTLIQQAYGDEYENVMVELLDLYRVSKQDLNSLQDEREFGSVVEQYAERQQYNANNVASKSAFERWQEQHNKKV